MHCWTTRRTVTFHWSSSRRRCLYRCPLRTCQNAWKVSNIARIEKINRKSQMIYRGVLIVWWLTVSAVVRQVIGSSPPRTRKLAALVSPSGWLIKGLGMSSCVCVTGLVKDPVPLIEKSRSLSPSGRFPSSFIHQVVIITGRNKL